MKLMKFNEFKETYKARNLRKKSDFIDPSEIDETDISHPTPEYVETTNPEKDDSRSNLSKMGADA